MPQFTLSAMGNNFLEVVENFKLHGVIIRSDMKWYDNTNYICQKGYERLWMLRRLKGLGVSEDSRRLVRSVLELAVPVWQPALTQQEANQIEWVQRCAFYIILGDGYVSYANALDTLEFEDLNTRRIRLCKEIGEESQI